MNIKKKVIALVIVPVIVNGGLLSVLYFSLMNVNESAQRQQNLIKRIQLLNDATVSFTRIYADLANFALTGHQSYRIHSLQILTSLKKDIDSLITLEEISSSLRESSRDISNMLVGELNQLAENEDQAVTAQAIVKIKKLGDAVTKAVRLAEKIKRVQTQQRQDLEESEQNQRQLIELVRSIVLAGFAINLITAAVLTRLILSQFSRRLNVLLKNSVQLAARGELLPPLSGRDELKVLDTALHSASQQIAQSFDFKASVMQMVAHDLRSPLMNAELTIELLKEEEAATLSPNAFLRLDSMKANNQKILSLAEDLLTCEQLDTSNFALTKARVPLYEIFLSARDSVDGLARCKGISIHVGDEERNGEERRVEERNEEELHDEKPHDDDGVALLEQQIFADSSRVVQVLTNLLTNAIKFSPKSSEIRLGHSLLTDRIEITVADQGCGIPRENASKIFNKFFQGETRATSSGVGLGLAICKMIVAAHGGEIGVRARSGIGSEFWFTLPFETLIQSVSKVP